MSTHEFLWSRLQFSTIEWDQFKQEVTDAGVGTVTGGEGRQFNDDSEEVFKVTVEETLDAAGVTALGAVIDAHVPVYKDPVPKHDGIPVVVPEATWLNGLLFVQRSLMVEVIPPAVGEGQTVSIADHLIETELKLSGGEYQIMGDGLRPGDRLTFSLVDKDGLIYAMTGGALGLPAGQVYTIHKFLDELHVMSGYQGPIYVQSQALDDIEAGFYLRVMVKSNTERADPSLASERAHILGRFKVYE